MIHIVNINLLLLIINIVKKTTTFVCVFASAVWLRNKMISSCKQERIILFGARTSSAGRPTVLPWVELLLVVLSLAGGKHPTEQCQVTGPPLPGHPGVVSTYPESMSFSLACSCEDLAWRSTCITHLSQRSRLTGEKKWSLRPTIGPDSDEHINTYIVDRLGKNRWRGCKNFVQVPDNSSFLCGLH